MATRALLQLPFKEACESFAILVSRLAQRAERVLAAVPMETGVVHVQVTSVRLRNVSGHDDTVETLSSVV